MIIYKLTRQDRTTRDGFKYPPKGSRLPELDGAGELCSCHWYHGYAHPLLAVLHAPIHVDSDYTKMIEIEVPKVYALDQMKLGFTTGIVGRVIPLPKITDEQRKRYAIGCACSVYKDRSFRKWADDWISGKDRTRSAARIAALVAWDVERDVIRNVAGIATGDARNSALATRDATRAARASATTIEAIRTVARHAVKSARYATVAEKDLDLIRIAEWAMTDEPLSALLEGRG